MSGAKSAAARRNAGHNGAGALRPYKSIISRSVRKINIFTETDGIFYLKRAGFFIKRAGRKRAL